MQTRCAALLSDGTTAIPTMRLLCWAQGLAKNDPPTVAGATYLAAVTANRVGTKIIAALIDVSQDATFTGSGASGCDDTIASHDGAHGCGASAVQR